VKATWGVEVGSEKDLVAVQHMEQRFYNPFQEGKQKATWKQGFFRDSVAANPHSGSQGFHINTQVLRAGTERFSIEIDPQARSLGEIVQQVKGIPSDPGEIFKKREGIPPDAQGSGLSGKIRMIPADSFPKSSSEISEKMPEQQDGVIQSCNQ